MSLRFHPRSSGAAFAFVFCGSVYLGPGNARAQVTCPGSDAIVLDCNGNGTDDYCDVSAGTSPDGNANGIPDECDATRCIEPWSGFEPNPPFSFGAIVDGRDYNGDGSAWENPTHSWTVASTGCAPSAGKAIKATPQWPLLSGEYVQSEYFDTLHCNLVPTAAIYQLTFDARSEMSINTRIDWQLTVRDASGGDLLRIHWASPESNYPGVLAAQGGNGRGRILVANPSGSPAFINTGFAIPLDTCYNLRIVLNNVTNTIELYIDGALRVTTTRLQPGVARMDSVRIVQVGNGQSYWSITRLGLDNFGLCLTGGAIGDPSPGDCNSNGIDDSCELTFGSSNDVSGPEGCVPNGVPDECDPDCNQNGVADACDLSQGTSFDCNTNAVLDECEVDCNLSAILDACDIASGVSQDCQGNAIPDECEAPTGTEPDIARTLTALNAGHAFISSLVPTRFDFSEGATGVEIVDGGSDMYNNGNRLNTNLATNIPYTNAVVTAGDSRFGAASRYFTAKYPGLFVLAATHAQISTFHVSGQTGTGGIGTVQGAVLSASLRGRPYRIYLKRIYGAGDPSINHIIIVPGEGAGVLHTWSNSTSNDLHTLSGLAGVRELYYLLVARHAGAQLSDGDAQRIANAFLVRMVLPMPDCNGNLVHDECDLSGGTSADCDSNGTPDECAEDCNANAIADGCDITAGTSEDCQANGIPDECELTSGTAADCNTNGNPDACDIASGSSVDLVGAGGAPDGIPDECQADCNANRVPDVLDIALGTSANCNNNGVPDECDIRSGDSDDLVGRCRRPDGVPDECQPDLDGDLVPDEVASGTVFLDCNGDGIEDYCEIAAGSSPDADGNGIPDECDAEVCIPGMCDGFELMLSGSLINGVDCNGDGNTWSNPNGSWSVVNVGCPAGQGRALKGVAPVPPVPAMPTCAASCSVLASRGVWPAPRPNTGFRPICASKPASIRASTGKSS